MPKKLKPCVGPHRFKMIKPVWLKGIPGMQIYTAGPGYLYRCEVCKFKYTRGAPFGMPYSETWVSYLEFMMRDLQAAHVTPSAPGFGKGKGLDLMELFQLQYDILKQRNSAAAWYAELREAAERREFPNLLFAERWINALDNAGMYGGSWRRNSE